MVTIMLVCNAGMSTSVLVSKMQKAAEAKAVEATIFAIPASEVVKQEIDVLLTSPQVKFMVKQYKEKFKPETKGDAINRLDYGTMNGEKVLGTALEMAGI